MANKLPESKPGDYSKGYAKGHGDKKDGFVEQVHQSIGLTKSDNQKSEAFQQGRQQGKTDKKAGR